MQRKGCIVYGVARHPYRGAKRTNIAITVKGLGRYGAMTNIWPIANPRPDLLPNARYIAIAELKYPRHTFLFTSKDGLTWDLRGRREILRRKNDCQSSLVLGPDGVFRAFVRRHLTSGPKVPYHRAVDVVTSRDLKSWSRPKLLLKTDPKPGQKAPSDQPYGMPVLKLDGVYLCLLPMLRVTSRVGKRDVGTMDIELLTSRDSIRWDWPFRGTSILPCGRPGQWDARMVYSNSGIVEWRGRWLTIYAGGPLGHGSGSPLLLGGVEFDRGRLIVVRQQDPRKSAWLITRPLPSTAGRLLLNAHLAGGRVRVSLLDAKGNVLPGFESDKSTLTRADSLRYRVTWPGKAALPGTVRPRLRIELTGGARLHAYEIVQQN